jgi:hypothetical protein
VSSHCAPRCACGHGPRGSTPTRAAERETARDDGDEELQRENFADQAAAPNGRDQAGEKEPRLAAEPRRRSRFADAAERSDPLALDFTERERDRVVPELST